MTKAKQKAFMELYEPVHLRLSNYCRSVSWCQVDTEDLLNDTIAAAFEQFGKLANKEAFAGYLFSIASNLYKKGLRRNKFKGSYEEKEALLIEGLDANPEIKTELSMVLQKMEQLPHLQREALILFHISDLSMEEIRKIQGGSLSAVKQRIKRGREHLMKLVTEKQQLLITLIF